MTEWWHGTPTPGLDLLEPRPDPRTGITGVFVTEDPFQPVVFSMLEDRASTNVDIYTRPGFLWAFLVGKKPLLECGWVYQVDPGDSPVVEWSPGRYYIDGPARVLDQRRWDLKDLDVQEFSEEGQTFAYLRIPV